MPADDRERRVVGAPELLRIGIGVHERELRHGHVDERVARGRALAEPGAGDEQEIGLAVALREAAG